MLTKIEKLISAKKGNKWVPCVHSTENIRVKI